MILSNDPTHLRIKQGNNVTTMEKPGVNQNANVAHEPAEVADARHTGHAAAVQYQQDDCNVLTNWKCRAEEEAKRTLIWWLDKSPNAPSAAA